MRRLPFRDYQLFFTFIIRVDFFQITQKRLAKPKPKK
jgi:hypothetical protein